MKPQSYYTLKELAEALNMTRFKLRRMLDTAGVRYDYSGKHIQVALSELLDKMPTMMPSIRYLELLESIGGHDDEEPGED